MSNDAAVGQYIKIGEDVTLSYEVLYVTSPARAIVRFDMGLCVLVDRDPNGKWGLSGKPANAAETDFIEKNMPSLDGTEVDVEKDEP